MFAIHRGDRVHHFECRAQRPLGIILVRDRRAEQRHDFVADEFVDHAFVLLHDRHQRLKAGVHQLAHFLGIFLFRQRGEAGNVGENDRDQLAFVFRRLFFDCRRRLRNLLAQRRDCRIDNCVAQHRALRFQRRDRGV